ALIHNFYKTIMSQLDTKAFGLKKTSRIKAFVFRFISVPAKWIVTASQRVLKIYTENHAYAGPFRTESG
ncbi:MAG: IS1380 family transposase, partial [Prevotellaceae bacterium]|nr:IS1380 family transposase [Candidatus Minthosoma caballi]